MGEITFIGLLLIFSTMVIVRTEFVFEPAKTSFQGKYFSDEGADNESANDKERMLCNAIVRATHDLYIYQKKSANEINNYLDEDCKKLVDEDLVGQCHEMVKEYGAKIYEHVKNGTGISEICQKIDDYSETDLDNVDDDDSGNMECSRESKDKCRCCKIHVERRKMRLRHIVKRVARRRLYLCKHSHHPHLCRFWIRQKERRILKKIDEICPCAICKHLGYCNKTTENNGVLEQSTTNHSVDSSSLLLEILLDVQLDTYFIKNICSKFEQLQTMCVHLSASVDSRRYTKTYMAMLQNDTVWIEKNLRKEIQSFTAEPNQNQCDKCKNTIQTSTKFYTNNLETVFKTLMDTCGYHSSKEKCQDMFNQQFNSINSYLHSMKSDEFCAKNHYCSLNMQWKCGACVQRFQSRQDATRKIINQVLSYLPNLCTKSNSSKCLEFIAVVTADIRILMDESNVQNTCLAMGFCEQNTAQDLADYDRAYVETMNKEICPMLAPFHAVCQQIVQGSNETIETVSLSSTTIENFFENCEDVADAVRDKVVAIIRDDQDKNKCQSCINRVIQKKKCAKKRVAKYVEHMKDLCKRCPAREQCERRWDEKKIRWDAKIDKICPRTVCTHMGYCNGIQWFGQAGEHSKIVPFVDTVIN